MDRIFPYLLLIFLSDQLVIGQDHIHWGSTGDTNNGLTITWHSTETADQIRWGYTATYEQGAFSGAYRNDYSGYLYDYTFPSVSASSIIYYSIYSNGSWTLGKSFRTSVSPTSNNFSFIAGGDSRTNMDDWETAAGMLAAETVDFHLFLGDHVWSGYTASDWIEWYKRGVNYLENNLIYHTSDERH